MNLTRDLKLSRSAYIISVDIGADANTVEISFSSEQPVLRDFGYEVLEHSTRAINSERIEGGLPVLWNHNRDNQIGRAEGIYLDQASKKLRAVVRFSKRQAAQEILQDIKDGIIKDVSFGYCIDDWEATRSTSPNEPDTVVATRWTPFETSFVSIPADVTVGVGRSMDIPKEELKEEAKTDEQAPVEETATEVTEIIEKSVETENVVVADEVINEEQRSRESIKTECIISNIQTPIREVPILKGNRNMTLTPEEVLGVIGNARKFDLEAETHEMITSGLSKEEIGARQLTLLAAKQTSVKATPAIDSRELKGYSLGRAIQAHITGDWSKAGLEREASIAEAKRLGRDTAGFLVPGNAIRAANTHNTLGVGQGKEMVMTEYAGFIDMLRPASRLLSLGVTVASGLTGNFQFVVETSAPVTYWMAENSGTDVTDTKIGLTTKTLSPKQLMAQMSYTRTQLMQSVDAFDTLLTNRLVREHALAIDSALIGYKSNPAGAPTGGILSDGTVPVVALGTNGVGITVDASVAAVFSLKTAVHTANALTSGCAYLTTPQIQGKLEICKVPGPSALAQAVWASDRVNGYAAVSSSNVPSNLDKGSTTGVGVCHPVIFGDFSNVVLGDWGVLEIVLDPFTLAGQGAYRLISNQLVDVGITRPTAFAVIKDALNS